MTWTNRHFAGNYVIGDVIMPELHYSTQCTNFSHLGRVFVLLACKSILSQIRERLPQDDVIVTSFPVVIPTAHLWQKSDAAHSSFTKTFVVFGSGVLSAVRG